MHTSSSQEDPGSISQLQNNVRQAECRFQAVFDQAAVGMALVSLEGQWLQLNQKLCDILGYTRLELRRMTFQDITHSDDLDADLAYVQQLLADKIETYAMDKGLTTWRVYGEITQATNNK
jgi:PAS domain S-box-containing protein